MNYFENYSTLCDHIFSFHQYSRYYYTRRIRATSVKLMISQKDYSDGFPLFSAFPYNFVYTTLNSEFVSKLHISKQHGIVPQSSGKPTFLVRFYHFQLKNSVFNLQMESFSRRKTILRLKNNKTSS